MNHPHHPDRREFAFLAAWRSIRDIGNQLYVVESTVKWHLGSIYSKIGVKNKTQAIARGRQLGLIS